MVSVAVEMFHYSFLYMQVFFFVYVNMYIYILSFVIKKRRTHHFALRVRCFDLSPTDGVGSGLPSGLFRDSRFQALAALRDVATAAETDA